MLIGLSNIPRDSAWGSPVLLAELEGREPTGAPEAEVWFGDHPASPAIVLDGTGRTLDQWLATEGAASGAPIRLPYLLKLLAAASTLSIQAHPSKAHAESAFAREESAGIGRDAAHRSYRDDNHKPELIVALSDRFEALVGVREIEATRRLLGALGDAAGPVLHRLGQPDGVRGTIGWLLSGEAQDVVDAVIAAAATTESVEFATELEVSRRLAAEYPHDPGVVVALLMNVMTLRRGEAVFVDAGVLHAYLSGLGVELMAASDNVLRGGLTPKHIDVPELMQVMDDEAGPVVPLRPAAVTDGVERFAPGIDDFELLRVESAAQPRIVDVRAPAIVLATAGEVLVSGAGAGGSIRLCPGQALLATGDESPLRFEGAGEAFIAQPGR